MYEWRSSLDLFARQKTAKNTSARRIFISVSLKSSIVVLLLYLRKSHRLFHISPPRGTGGPIETYCVKRWVARGDIIANRVLGYFEEVKWGVGNMVFIKLPLRTFFHGDDDGKGPFKNYVTRLGGKGLGKKVTKCDKGEGVSQKSDVTHPKNFICSFSSFCSSKVCQIHNFIQFLCYCTSFWWKSSKISDQIITLERLFFIDFQDQSLSLFGEWHGGEGGRDKRWQSVTRGEGGQK